MCSWHLDVTFVIQWWGIRMTWSHRSSLKNTRRIFKNKNSLKRWIWSTSWNFWIILVLGKGARMHRIMTLFGRFVIWKRFHVQNGKTSSSLLESWSLTWGRKFLPLTPIAFVRHRQLKPRNYFLKGSWTRKSECSLIRKQVCNDVKHIFFNLKCINNTLQGLNESWTCANMIRNVLKCVTVIQVKNGIPWWAPNIFRTRITILITSPRSDNIRCIVHRA